MRRCNPILARVFLLVLSVLVLPSRADAALRAYASRGGAQFVSPTEFIGSGHATHLGAYTEAGEVSFAPTGDPDVLRVAGSIVYIAANGDELHATVDGALNMATGVVSAQVTYVGGTGRFEKASGSAALAGLVSPTGAIVVGVRGTIDY